MPVSFVGVGPGRDQTIVLPSGGVNRAVRVLVARRRRARRMRWRGRSTARRRSTRSSPRPATRAWRAIGKRCVPVDANDPAAVRDLAGELDADLVVVSPEDAARRTASPTRSRAHGMLVFGPGADGARLEGSKAWMKDVLAEAGRADRAPRARSRPIRRTRRSRSSTRLPGLYVVKTDGLAAGQGRRRHRVARRARGRRARLPLGRAFGDAGRTCVIEEGLTGPGAVAAGRCATARTDGCRWRRRRTSSASATATAAPTRAGWARTRRCPSPAPTSWRRGHGARRATDAARARGARHRRTAGCSTPGSCSRRKAPKVLEYNVRFGDPECAGRASRGSPATSVVHLPRSRRPAALETPIAVPGRRLRDRRARDRGLPGRTRGTATSSTGSTPPTSRTA